MAVVTVFNADGSVDYGRLEVLVERQIAAGIDGIVPVGTTGESPTLTFDEHLRVIKTVIETNRQRVKIIAGTGANSMHEALRLTGAAKEYGADATLQVTPYYNKPNQEGLYRHFQTVADLGLPVVLYNIPGRCGVEIALETVERLSRHPKVVAIKEAAGDVLRVTKIRQRCRLTVLSGDDPLTLPMMILGAKGVISVASNIIPDLVTDLTHAALAGNWEQAQALHQKCFPLFTGVFLDTNPIPVKAGLGLLGLIEEFYRLPLTPLRPELRDRLAEILRELELI